MGLGLLVEIKVQPGQTGCSCFFFFLIGLHGSYWDLFVVLCAFFNIYVFMWAFMGFIRISWDLLLGNMMVYPFIPLII